MNLDDIRKPKKYSDYITEQSQPHYPKSYSDYITEQSQPDHHPKS